MIFLLFSPSIPFDILIVDDIYTTGATIEAVAKVLQKHKALRIDALTLASGSF